MSEIRTCRLWISRINHYKPHYWTILQEREHNNGIPYSELGDEIDKLVLNYCQRTITESEKRLAEL